MRVYLTGFMGSGKSSVGRHLAQRLGAEFLDLDQEIERAAGMTVREIFERHGEPAFRQMVATGGGTVTFEANARWIAQQGIAVWLHPAFATIVARIGGLGKHDRPLFRDEAQALALYRERLPAYRKADLTVDVRPGERAEEVAARIALLLGKR